jgi:hypothetical protein
LDGGANLFRQLVLQGSANRNMSMAARFVDKHGQ